jgi:hypothetical protein
VGIFAGLEARRLRGTRANAVLARFQRAARGTGALGFALASPSASALRRPLQAPRLSLASEAARDENLETHGVRCSARLSCDNLVHYGWGSSRCVVVEHGDHK